MRPWRVNATLTRSLTIGGYTRPGRHKWRPYVWMGIFRQCITAPHTRRGRINATLVY